MAADFDGPGLLAAEQLERRARDAGIEVRIDLPSRHRADWADVLAASAPRAAFDAPVAHNYTSTVKEIAYSRAAVRTLARMPANLADRIRGRIRAYTEDPSSQARNVRRLRVGDWRIVMRDADTLEVLHITTRGHAYRD